MPAAKARDSGPSGAKSVGVGMSVGAVGGGGITVGVVLGGEWVSVGAGVVAEVAVGVGRRVTVGGLVRVDSG